MEFLKNYPQPYPREIVGWIEELKSFSLESLAQLESFPHENKVGSQSFKFFLKKVRLLSVVQEQKIDSSILPNSLSKKLNKKKKHEISVVKSLVNKYTNIDQVLDIGGGLGNLSSALTYQSQINCLCLDANNSLTRKGEARDLKRVRFINENFDNQTKVNINGDKSIIIGLHGCGKLTSDIIQYYSREKIKGLLSFGCCYHKIVQDPYISQKAKTKSLNLTTNAFHLASRCGKIVTSKDLEKRFLFKRFRYSLHYYLNDNFDYDFYSIGNAKSQDYLNSFSDYAKKYHKGNELKEVSHITLNDFFESETTRKKVNENILADMIRLFLGRLIELYIVLDRVIFLEENGYKVKLSQVFDREFSPRNLLIESSST